MSLPAPRTLAALVALLALSLALVACSEDEAATAAGPGTLAEQAFLSAMVPHHESAVEMAEIAQRRAGSSVVRDLADAIVQDQRAEIAQIGDIHRRLFGSEVVPDAAAHKALGLSAEEAGMASQKGDAMDALAAAEPFDRAFVDAMIPHHLGAIAMAQAVLERAENPEVRELAQSIVTGQLGEVERMREFRRERFGAPAAGAGMAPAVGMAPMVADEAP